MLRAILAVVATYIAMSILIIGTFMGLWMGVGINGLLEPGTFKGNWFLCIAAPSITVVAGLLGGVMCAKIARTRGPVIALAAVVFLLGGLSAFFTLQKPEPTGPRDPAMTMQQFMEVGREPTWLAVFNPLGGAAAVLLGGLVLVKPRKVG
ncbi:MAG: hypothetical protein ACT4PL_09400 [Phycisphaerales bacterium]